MKFDSLCLFLPTCNTFTFLNGEVTTNNETVLEFIYTAQSDGNKKTMVAFKDQIVGYSTYIADDDLPF
jgi:hypothetical protein